jgi:hypothetical protein
MLGLIKDLVFRSSASDKECLYRYLSKLVLEQNKCPVTEQRLYPRQGYAGSISAAVEKEYWNACSLTVH